LPFIAVPLPLIFAAFIFAALIFAALVPAAMPMPNAPVILARTPGEVRLYVEIHGGNGVEVVSRSSGDEGELWVVATRDGRDQPQRYTFRVQHPEEAGLGSGRSECLDVSELVDHAERLAATIPADVAAIDEQQFERLQQVVAIADQALRSYDPGSLQPKLQRQPASSLHYRKDLVTSAAGAWQDLYDAARAHRKRASSVSTEAAVSAPPTPPAPPRVSPQEKPTARQIETRHLTWYSLYLSTGDDRNLAGLLLDRGRDFESAGHLDRARADFERASELFGKLGDAQGLGASRVRLGGLAYRAGSLRDARTHYDAALLAFESIGDARGKADALCGRGCLWSLGDSQERAESDLDRALELFHSIPSSDGVASASLERARLRARRGVDPAGAELDFREAERLLERLGDPRASEARAGYEALLATDDALSVESITEPLARGDALKARAMAAAERGDLRAAHQQAAQALALFEQHGAPVSVANVLLDRAKLYHVEGNLELASADLSAAMATFEAQGLELGKANVFEARGDLAQRAEDLAAAQHHYRRALSLYERLGIGMGIANTHAELARVAARLGDLSAARTHARAALTHARGGVSDYAMAAATELLSAIDGSNDN
jgi:tetratricopeptide (TPR) repeat protein